MGNLIKLTFAVLSLLVIGCAKQMPTQLRKPNVPIVNPGNGPEGKPKVFFKAKGFTQNGQSINLNRSTVIIFASDTCVICAGEHEKLVKFFKQLGHVPQNVDLYTVLVGGIVEDAHAFAENFKLPWNVIVQPETAEASSDELFRTFCPEQKVPCVIVQTQEKGFVFQKTGEFSVAELEPFTGRWE